MSMKKLKIDIWYLIIILLFINYQIVTIILHDNIAFRYLRDLFLLVQLFLTFLSAKNNRKISVIYIFLAFWSVFLAIGFVKTKNATVGITFLRRYIFPILTMIIAANINSFKEKDFYKFFCFILRFFTLLSIWGIIQAWVLTDSFLIRLGYPTKSYSGKLRDSFYFGNLGIQRVVSTVSNSNVFALVLGTTILVALLNAKSVLKTRFNRICLIIICFAYLLTFSRANFLAMMIVGLLIYWKSISRKIRLRIKYFVGIFAFLLIIAVITKNSYIMQIFGWIQNTLSGNEASSANRVSIWADAFRMVVKNPFGMGFGHVGAFAQISNTNDFVHAENSYLAIAIDLGIIGLFIYLTFIFVLIRRFKKYKNNFGRSSIALVLYMMICFMFSNHIYDMEAVVYIYLLIGLFYNLTICLKQKESVNDGFFCNSMQL